MMSLVVVKVEIQFLEGLVLILSLMDRLNLVLILMS